MMTQRSHLVFLLASLLTLSLAACQGDLDLVEDETGGGDDPAAFFTANVQPGVSACSSCHISGVAGAPIFFQQNAGSDLRAAILGAQTAQGALVDLATPANSLLLTFRHVTQPAADLSANFTQPIQDWLALENSAP